MLFCFLFLSFSLSISLSMFKSPSSLAAAIVFLSGALVSTMALMSSYWFSYVLFLVYVGGLLVMFIYVCLVSSNFPFKLDFNRAIFSLGLSGLLLFSVSSPELKSVLGFNNWSSGPDLMEDWNLSLFLFLTVLLLVMLLVVVRSTGSGSVKINV
uniref:NADH dehydrogenase subunit 6 n=1 Tax=Elysia atroviridis TaxID=1247391 RepID=UPI00208EFCAB|nr:NADH dehydrogenase subunit 6 [Elysia atroviridis]USC52123.1 NADH dehydrogenase subunit 6 [Elysia atroviridis]